MFCILHSDKCGSRREGSEKLDDVDGRSADLLSYESQLMTVNFAKARAKKRERMKRVRRKRVGKDNKLCVGLESEPLSLMYKIYDENRNMSGNYTPFWFE